MTEIEKAIKHFESLQKRYTTLHNGTQCALVETALEALREKAEREKDPGSVSDGYHTFNELYHHRAVLFSVICNNRPELAWKSLKHDTGDMFPDMFIVGIETPGGQATYHYDIDPCWEMFQVKELPNAPKWDGHTPTEAIRRIGLLSRDNNPPLTEEQIREMVGQPVFVDYNLTGTKEWAIIKSVSDMKIWFSDGMYIWLNDIDKTVDIYAHEPKKDGEQNDKD